jgi:cytochrome b
MGRLKYWHWALAASFVVAWATADEDTYTLHLISGYAVLALLAARLLAGIVAGDKSRWRLPRPALRPAFAWMAIAVMGATGVAAVTGVAADRIPLLEHPHEALAELTLWVIGAHVAFIAFMYRGRKWLRRLGAATPALALAVAAVPALAGDPKREPLIAAYAVEAGGQAFSAQRGETLFRTKWAGGDERTPSCTACHTDDPTRMGQNAKTGRPIDPVAPSVNSVRFTDRAQVEKHFARDCKSVLGRECTPLEKGDYVTFMAGR